MGLSSKAIKASAWAAVAAGVAAPLLRRRVKAPAAAMQLIAFSAPLGLSVALPRSRFRDVGVCCLQMWAYVAAYKAPHDDCAAQEARVHVDYPIAIDRVLGLGRLPTVRLQERLASTERWRRLDHILVWVHWIWFAVPHTALAWILWRRPERFVRAAVMTYAVFDLGACVYWVLPTAPPWYAAGADERRDLGVRLDVRRMMAEYGEFLWKDGWAPLYRVFGGNPLAAMPSLHFATSLMAALLLAETGPLAGAVGVAYTGTLAFALVYLGEHYVIDLIAGAGLTLAVKRAAPVAAPALSRVGRVISQLQARASGECPTRGAPTTTPSRHDTIKSKVVRRVRAG